MNPGTRAERRALFSSRSQSALVVALIGSGAFLAMGRLVPFVLETVSPLAGCFLGAFASSLTWYDDSRSARRHIVVSAVSIVAATFVAIGVGLGLESVGEAPAILASHVYGGVLTMLFFGAIYAMWWVLPALVLILWARRRGGPWRLGTSILAAIGFCGIALWIWPQLTSHKSYLLTIRNEGALAVVGGVLEDGDERRSLGPIPAGHETTFALPRKGDARGRILLHRIDQSSVVCEVPWLGDGWGIDGTERDRLVVPDDTCRLVRTDDELHTDSGEESPSRRR